jgi:ABC-type phosphate transport system substrate-binding protein
MGSVPAVRRAISLLIGALALASCGGGDEGTTSTTEASSTSSTHSITQSSTSTTTTTSGSSTAEASNPKESLNAVLVKGDCENDVTDHFIGVADGGGQACKQSTQAGGTADSIDVRSVFTNGDTAKATVVPDGGPSSGDRLTVTLVRERDVWKVDALKSNAAVGP